MMARTMSRQMRKSARRLVKDRVKEEIGEKVLWSLGGPVVLWKYLPQAYGFPPGEGTDAYSISKQPRHANEGVSDGFNIPPRAFWLGYGNDFGDKGPEWYITKGKRDTERMLAIATASDFSLTPGSRILEMGCAAGRMTRHLNALAESCEVWGVDVMAPLINWCKENLTPPFHFATTTTVPHLPFEDAYFDFIYTGSVFTHIADLADAWLLELRRVLSPGGRLYVTIHDRHAIELLDEGYYYDRSGYFTDKDRKETELTNQLNSDPTYVEEKDNFGMLVIGRDVDSQVFYDVNWFCNSVDSMYHVVSVAEEAYGHQTAVLLEKTGRPDRECRAVRQAPRKSAMSNAST